MLYAAKLTTFGQLGSLTMDLVIRGLAIGTASMVGPFIARRFVQRVRPAIHAILIDMALVAAAVGMFLASSSTG